MTRLFLNFAVRGLTLLAALATWEAAAEDLSIEAAGGRFGFPVTHGSQGFLAAEAFMNCNLPAFWELGSDFQLKARIDFTAGWLGRSGDNAATTSAGPTFALNHKRFPLWLELGTSPTLISLHEFGNKDLGGPFQFTTHVSLTWEITRRCRLEYRYQHTSNAGIDGHNPGLNLQSFGLAYLF